ncbi:1,2-dihydroxy-3-keto-5-methylthiopentene dioxygenase [Acrasis kona]|uniref:Acireductone dioxygenase n=1 Tax=Acrasis kona TaxID=1008807 RepID=A0AAW2YN48_9EUKA
MKAYYLDNEQQVSTTDLDRIGVLNWKLNPEDYEEDLKKIEQERNYGHRSIVNLSESTLPNFGEMMKKFFEEHLHEFEEIRFILDGEGYFDVREKDDKWIRIELVKGDLIVLPAGMYHRFTLTDTKYAKAMRLFVNTQKEPIWTPVNRGENSDSLECRKEYLKTQSVN